MAGKAPEDRRHSALREASFSVPYEVARLNPDAKEFQIEDMVRDWEQDLPFLAIFSGVSARNEQHLGVQTDFSSSQFIPKPLPLL